MVLAATGHIFVFIGVDENIPTGSGRHAFFFFFETIHWLLNVLHVEDSIALHTRIRTCCKQAPEENDEVDQEFQDARFP